MKLKSVLGILTAGLLLCSCGVKESEVVYEFPDKPELVLGPRDSEQTAETPKPETTPKPTVSYVRKELSGILKMVFPGSRNFLIEAKAKEFEALYPDVKIEIEYVQTRGDMKVYVERIKKDLAEGKCADIVSLSGLPYAELTGQGYFADISWFVDNDATFIKDDYYMGVIDAFRQNGGALYSFCTRFYPADLYSINRGVTAGQLDHFLTAADISFVDMLSMYNSVRSSDYTYFSSEFNPKVFFENIQLWFVNTEYNEAKYGSEAFTNILKYAKAAPRLPYINYRQTKAITVTLRTPLNPNSTFTFYELVHGDYEIFFNEAQNEFTAPRQISAGNGLYRFLAQDYFGISENSTNKDAAWEFLKYVTQFKEQEYESLEQFVAINGLSPVNKRGFEVYSNLLFWNAYKKILKFLEDNPTSTRDVDDSSVFDAAKILISAAGKCNTVYGAEDGISDIVWQEFYLLYNDGQSADRAAENIQESVTQYLKSGKYSYKYD